MHLPETASREAARKSPAEGMASTQHKVAFPGDLSGPLPPHTSFAPASHQWFHHLKLVHSAPDFDESPLSSSEGKEYENDRPSGFLTVHYDTAAHSEARPLVRGLLFEDETSTELRGSTENC